MEEENVSEFLFHQGTNFYSYDYLGCNASRDGNVFKYTFRVWAPNADSVALVSDFSGWDSTLFLERVTDKGVYELLYQSDKPLWNKSYKFIVNSGNKTRYKGDPYAFFSRGGADGASLIYDRNAFKFDDTEWMNFRKKCVGISDGYYLCAPINIYEIHLGSFARHRDGSYYSYQEMSELLPAYVKKMGYTHVEFLPLQEHPLDDSWGYQICAFYAPTSRYGDPDGLKQLINELHKAGIGVILDWVPAHFPKDEWGLYEFDGQPLYEYQGKDRQESNSWGTRFFDLGREEVQSFLISNALYFLREYHLDGLRVDAVAAMIYLDYDKKDGEWIPAEDGSNRNKEAIAFLKKLNCAVFSEFPDVLMIAEESSSFEGITKPIDMGGLGFNLKWNMGFANDFYKYMSTDPIYRRFKHEALTFPIMYAFGENYCLPISHDEVVHGKKAFIDKMNGDYEDKFWQARIALLTFMSFPGKKLLFMGCEFAQFREWDCNNSLEWFMLEYPAHKSYLEYARAINAFYLSRSELWELDFVTNGFEWITCDNSEQNVIAFKRYGKKRDFLIIAINFSGAEQIIRLPLENQCGAEVIFHSGNFDKTIIESTKGSSTVNIRLPKFCGVVLTEKSDKTIFNL